MARHDVPQWDGNVGSAVRFGSFARKESMVASTSIFAKAAHDDRSTRLGRLCLHFMKAPFALPLLLLISSGSLAWSQFIPKSTDARPAATTAGTPAPTPGALTQTPAPAANIPGLPPGVRVMRAIPVEVPTVIPTTPLPNNLPNTLPADAKVVYSQCLVEAPVIAITFDDGPHPENTPRLLDMLKQRGIKATFFMVGRCVTTWPGVVKRIAEEGHEVANHSWSHPNLAPMKDLKLMDQLQKTHDAIIKACGVAPILYRPPYGSIRMTQRKAIHERFGYPTILWDVDPLDWQSPRTVSKVYNRILAQTKPGSIILCHDIHQPTVDAMPALLDELTARGYRFVTVTELINLDSQTTQKQAALAAQQAALNPPAPAHVPAIDGATSPPQTIAPAIIPNSSGLSPTIPTTGSALPSPQPTVPR